MHFRRRSLPFLFSDWGLAGGLTRFFGLKGTFQAIFGTQSFLVEAGQFAAGGATGATPGKMTAEMLAEALGGLQMPTANVLPAGQDSARDQALSTVLATFSTPADGGDAEQLALIRAAGGQARDGKLVNDLTNNLLIPNPLQPPILPAGGSVPLSDPGETMPMGEAARQDWASRAAAKRAVTWSHAWRCAAVLGYHWYQGPTRAAFDAHGTPLPASVALAQSVELAATVVAPDVPEGTRSRGICAPCASSSQRWAPRRATRPSRSHQHGRPCPRKLRRGADYQAAERFACHRKRRRVRRSMYEIPVFTSTATSPSSR
jgi:hypothetical protein